MSQLPPDVRVSRLASAYQLSRAVQVAARLDLGRLLANGPRTARELADATATDHVVLARLLRFLAELEVVVERSDGRFAPTELCDHLHLADNLTQGEEAWAAWAALPQALRHGRPVFSDVHGATFWDYAEAHPQQATRWLEWNGRLARSLAVSLAKEPSLETTETVVDVGGGTGTLLAALLRRHRHLRGVLLDLPRVVAHAAASLARAGVAERATLVAGDARTHVPAGGDLYLLCRVLFNWDANAARQILAACRRVTGQHGRLWILEPLLPEPGDPPQRGLAGADLHHFLLWGGGYRRATEMEELLAIGGFSLAAIRRLDGGWPLIEARPDSAAAA